ncbi:hypothetical protein AKJ08_2511 [Vulgatibacter incomptus]|uniref:Cytochrome c domain-containing protein n=2 Tax=Vulgatibacter incomptus TaxID=1391653 RepID=A0A0K1PG87_9BACT|nr:hypothetical protein AKJ08_2511 [Vulgatibacter incomptus]
MALVAVGTLAFALQRTPAREPAVLRAVGPRLISNQTDYPVMIYGEALRPGLRLAIGELRLETSWVDEGHLGAVIPAGIEIPAAQAVAVFEARLEGADGSAPLTVVNDAAFPTPLDLEVAAGRVFAVSRTTDELLVVEASGEVRRVPTCDGPRSLAKRSRDELLVIACEHGGELRLVSAADPAGPQRSIPLSPGLQQVIVEGDEAWVTEHVRESVLRVDLGSGRVIGRYQSPVDPRPLALLGDRLLVGNASTEDLTLVLPSEARTLRVSPDSTTPIVGGHTETYALHAMGGKRPRAVVASDRLGVFFVSSVGPNIGPNPDRMEVTMNGGIGVVDREGRFLRHVALRQGLPEGLALDDERGFLYVADVSTGRVEILDAARLAAGDADSREAFVASLEIPPSVRTPRLRDGADFGVEGRASESLHSGPVALRLSEDRRTLWVLARFDGAVQAVDVSAPWRPELGLRIQLFGTEAQPSRRLGEIAYHTDLGKTRMSCDACHPDGHTGGMLFTKGRPMRIYRSTSLRTVRDSAPYFTPSMLPTLRHMARDVLARNRFQNPKPTSNEIAALAHYTETLTPLPNPFVGPKGELPTDLELPGGGRGDAVAGLRAFEASGCGSCHPAPQFTTDQDEATRGRLHRGTPLALPLRPELQDMARDPGWPPVSLVGVWDVFPLLASGAAGLEVQGDAIVPQTGLALRRVLEPPLASGVHAAAASLSEKERDDLVAYLLTL